eukprot:TRINITY_DN13266_c2_g1_i1.p1 TRINITY_DN13266_c2_g1~~TRINITY_DN13266_c2_g1_i1.p1  ORF type:complete len:162 (+),score=31.92 TRINITY_DN13266_c2_g1_i1:438-923(+)
MQDKGYVKCESDHCIYFKGLAYDRTFPILLLYVDDMLIASNDVNEVKNLKLQMSKCFATKDLGPAKKILGMNIERDRKHGKLWLSQYHNISKVLERFNMNDCKSVSTTLADHFKLSKQESPKNKADRIKMQNVPYTSAVGSSMYAMDCTRLDIAHAVGVVS